MTIKAESLLSNNIYTYKIQIFQSELRAAYCWIFNTILEPKLIENIANNINN